MNKIKLSVQSEGQIVSFDMIASVSDTQYTNCHLNCVEIVPWYNHTVSLCP